MPAGITIEHLPYGTIFSVQVDESLNVPDCLAINSPNLDGSPSNPFGSKHIQEYLNHIYSFIKTYRLMTY